MVSSSFKSGIECRRMLGRSSGICNRKESEHTSTKKDQISNRIMCRNGMHLHENTLTGRWMTGNA
ncbi:hypothetical protein BGX29_001780, partial [Mortierella sp. GBA35]